MTDVTQEDRDLFKALFHYDDEDGARFVDQGLFDDHRRMRAIAAHRIAAERKGMMEAAEIARLRKALEWYANPRNWRTATVYMCGHSGSSNATADEGKRAIAALGDQP